MSTEKRVGIIVYYGYIAVAPSIINSIVMLTHAGYQVDLVIVREDRFPDHNLKDESVSVYSYTGHKSKNLLGRLKHVIGFALWTLRVSFGKKYICFIGIDPEGLIVASLLRAIKKVPVIYYSLELYTSSDHRGIKSRLKKNLERFCNQRALFTIIQDESRAACLVADNRIEKLQVRIVPNSALGHPKISEKDWWHRKFNLPSHCKVILQAGGIADWSLSYELAQAALEWPEDWVLILHGHGDQAYADRIRELSQDGRIFVSQDLVPYEQLDSLIASADIGIALYRNIDQNHFHIPSGKVAHYLKCGVPTVAIDFPNLRKLLHCNRCGICVASTHEIRDAVNQIFSQYQVFSENATRCYVEQLEFGKQFEKVLTEIAPLKG